MFRTVLVYLKNQTVYLLFLFAIFVFPLALFFQFSPYKLPNIQYAVLGCLFLFQYVSYNEKKYRKKIGSRVFKQYQKEIGRGPTNKEMHRRMNLIVTCRGLTIIFAALAISAIMIYYKKI